MNALGVGFALHPDLEYLELARKILERDADFFEINPETLWRPEAGRLVRNDYYPLYQQIRDRSGKPFVAHGLDFSVGTPLDDDRPRSAAWLERLRDDQAEFRFPWISEHLGWQIGGGIQTTLPLPLPPTPEAVAVVAERMRLLASVAGLSAFENPANYVALGDPAAEPAFFNEICRAAPCRLLLDLHNVHTQCLNLGLDPNDYVDRIDPDLVLEIHLSGGSSSDPDWLDSRRVFRLDSHDGPVPEEVWALYERVLPRCRGLRGVVVERLNGTFGPEDVDGLADEVRRAKELWRC
jgi:uncharacterized protein (UPF0276 family)